jgi:hypothetical protein
MLAGAGPAVVIIVRSPPGRRDGTGDDAGGRRGGYHAPFARM